MIKTYVSHDKNGRIIQMVRGEESLIEGDYLTVPDYVTANGYMIVDGEPVAIPESPGEFYAFDFAARQWVFSYDLASWRQRIKRDQLLAQSDWTQVSDVNLPNKQAWIDYRQALRDITKQASWPRDVVWPTIPK